jgi:hypothetical protein
MEDMKEIVLTPHNNTYEKDPSELVSYEDTNVRKYGKQLTNSHLCAVCLSVHHNRVNLLRGRDHKTLDEIVTTVQAPGITVPNLEKHFKNHFILNTSSRDIISLREENSPEAMELVRKVLDCEIDIFSAGQSILEVKNKQSHFIMNRIEFLNAHLEEDSADDIDKQEFAALNKVLTEITNSMLKVYVIMDKKLFPPSKDDLSNAVLQYKLNVLSKIIDTVQFALLELETNPKFYEAVQEIRAALAARIGTMEDEILKSGGIMK